MALADMIKADLMDIEADKGNQVFTWDGSDYVCSPSSVRSTEVLETGGLSDTRTLVIKVRKELFGDGVLPQSQQLLTFNGQSFGILTATPDTFGAFVVLTCVSNTRGS